MAQYIVSARKYRPDSFESLIGQDNIARTLKNSILRGQLAHAYLFCGPRGVGKTSAARIFAKTINCSNPGEDMEPCGECESCRSFQEGRSYCIHELDAASNNGVDDIKALMDLVQIPPQVGKYSVFIIDEVHMLSQSAFNAFLKTLEEPPAHAIFILATTEKHKILPTILSRCQTYDFNRISIPDIVRNLRDIASREGISIDEESMHVIARKADGAMRDALTIFDQTVAFCGTDIHYADVIRNLNVLDSEYNFRLVDAFLAGDYATALLTFDEILSKGFNALHFISSVGEHLRDLLVSRTGGLESLLDLPDSLRQRYQEQAARCSVKFLFEGLSAVSQCEAGYRASTNQRLHIEFTLMRLCFINAFPASAETRPVDRGSAPITARAPLSQSQPPSPLSGGGFKPTAVGPTCGSAGSATISTTSASAETRTVSTPSVPHIGEQTAKVAGTGTAPRVVGCADPTASGSPSYVAEGGTDSAGSASPRHDGSATVSTPSVPLSGGRLEPASGAVGSATVSTPSVPLSGGRLEPASGPHIAEPPSTGTVSEANGPAEPEAVVLMDDDEIVPAAAPKPVRKPRRTGAGLSLAALMSDDDDMVAAPVEEETVAAVETVLPDMAAVSEKWKELAARQSRQPRLANALANAKLQIVPGEGYETVQFSVTNESQKRWIEEKMLRELEGGIQELLACGKVRLEPVVIPEAEEEKKIYMPAEKARDLMEKNDEVKNLVKDLALDIK